MADLTQYTDNVTGPFKDNAAGDIGANDLRTFASDIISVDHDEIRRSIWNGSAYLPARNTDTTQTHLFIGTQDPTTSGFVVGTDLWIDTSGG